MSTEMRSLLAAVLCLLVIAGWSLIYKPPQPAPAAPAATATHPASPAAPATAPATTPSVTKAAAPAPVTMRAASAEASVVIESDLYHVEIFNRGGVVRSWQLKQ